MKTPEKHKKRSYAARKLFAAAIVVASVGGAAEAQAMKPPFKLGLPKPTTVNPAKPFKPGLPVRPEPGKPFKPGLPIPPKHDCDATGGFKPGMPVRPSPRHKPFIAGIIVPNRKK